MIWTVLLAALEKFVGEVLVPILVTEAEKMFSRGTVGTGPVKYKWVTDAANEFIDNYLAPKLPSFLKADADQIKAGIDAAIERAVANL